MSEDLESGPEPKLSREPSPQAEAPKSSWVKFDEDGSAAATLEPSQSVQMEPPSPAKLEAPLRKVPSPEPRPDLGPLPPPRPPLVGSPSAPAGAVCPPAPARLKPRASAQPGDNNNHVALPSARRVEPLAVPLSERLATRTTSSSGFSNGDVIVNALPTNKRCAWITKAEFKPELVPEELMASGLTLTVEEYVAAMQVLVHDVRFTLYNVCYKRLLLVWVLLGFFILLCLLFSGVRGLALFGGGVVWLVVNAMGIFVCMWLKFKLLHMLERCIASINSLFFRHKILLGLDDRGKISCHKVHVSLLVSCNVFVIICTCRKDTKLSFWRRIKNLEFIFCMISCGACNSNCDSSWKNIRGRGTILYCAGHFCQKCLGIRVKSEKRGFPPPPFFLY
ncbi:unnamed protein product [Ixodes pacificus]